MSRFIATLFALLKITTSRETILIIYSAHLPFILAGILLRLRKPKVKVCIIIPDLPEYMGGIGLVYSIFKSLECSIFYYLVKKLDFYVVLTSAMIERLAINKERTVVIEGIASLQHCVVPDLNKREIRSLLYSGTLARRYGVVDLLSAFSLLADQEVELWICGDGDCSNEVIFAATIDKRIKYFGQVDRQTAISLQFRATILVNPRSPTDEFTKYSFPSKIIEYMLSGRPVVMHNLPGIPIEYADHFVAPHGVSVVELALCFANTLKLTNIQLDAIGASAREFILTKKNSTVQVQKVLDLFFREKCFAQ